MEKRFSVRGMIFMLTLLVAGCATPPAQVSSVSTRNPQYDRTVKRVVVVIGNLGGLSQRTVGAQLLAQLKSNEVRGLWLEHNPLLFSQDPLRANQDVIRALNPNAILHLYALSWSNSLGTNVQATFDAALTIQGGRRVWGARLMLRGIEQGETALVTELIKKLVEDRIIDKNAIELDEPAGSNRT